MNRVITLLISVCISPLAFSQNVTEVDVSTIRVLRAFQNSSGKYLVEAVRKHSELQLQGRNVEFLVSDFYYGDLAQLQQLQVEARAGSISSANFEAQFFSYKGLVNPTSMIGYDDRILIQIDDLGTQRVDTYKKVNGEKLAQVQTELQMGQAKILLFPDLRNVEQILGQYVSQSPPMIVKILKNIITGSESLAVNQDPPISIAKATRNGFYGADGTVLEIQRGWTGKIKDIRLVRRSSDPVSVFMVDIPEGKVGLTDLSRGPGVPKMASPLDVFFPEGLQPQGHSVKVLVPNKKAAAQMAAGAVSCDAVVKSKD